MSATPTEIPDDLRAEAREAFNLFDKDSAGSIRTCDIGLVLRSLGFNLSDTDLLAMETEVDGEKLGFVKFHDFERLLSKAIAISKASSAEAKKVIKTIGVLLAELGISTGTDTQSVSIHDLKHLVTRIGEKMSTEEFSEMCRDLDIVDGKVSIDQLVNYLVI
jgi:calmodulin